MIRHDVRDKNPDGSYISFGRSAVDPERTHLNYRLGPSGDPHARLRSRLAEVKTQKRADLKVMLSWIVTRPLDGSVSDEETPRFFQAVYSHLETLYGGEKNVVVAAVHMDETTPHLHFCFVPAVRDKRHPEREKVCAKEVTTPRHMKTFHGELRKAVEKELGHSVGLVADELMQQPEPGKQPAASLRRKSLPLEVLKARALAEEAKAAEAEQRKSEADKAALEAETRRVTAERSAKAAETRRENVKRERQEEEKAVKTARAEREHEEDAVRAAVEQREKEEKAAKEAKTQREKEEAKANAAEKRRKAAEVSPLAPEKPFTLPSPKWLGLEPRAHYARRVVKAYEEHIEPYRLAREAKADNLDALQKKVKAEEEKLQKKDREREDAKKAIAEELDKAKDDLETAKAAIKAEKKRADTAERTLVEVRAWMGVIMRVVKERLRTPWKQIEDWAMELLERDKQKEQSKIRSRGLER